MVIPSSFASNTIRLSTPSRIRPRLVPRQARASRFWDQQDLDPVCSAAAIRARGASLGQDQHRSVVIGLVAFLAAAVLFAASACAGGAVAPSKGTSVASAAPEPPLPTGATLTRDPATGTVRFLKGQNLSRDLDGDPLFRAARASGDAEAVARAFLNAYAAVFRLDDPNRELANKRIDLDRIGTTHVRFDQTYQDLPIPGAELIVHLDRERRVVLVSGSYIATPRELAVTPAISANDARAIAARAGDLGADACDACATDLVVFAERGAPPRLAWRVAAPAGSIAASERWIDAQSGAPLRSLPVAIPAVRPKGEGWTR